MPKMPWHPASGTGKALARAQKIIRFARYGCTNRPFFHIVVIEVKREQRNPPVEQVGTYDPHPNVHDEKMVSLNLERIQYWLANGALLSTPVAELLGLSGFLPVHPKSYMEAWRNRRDKAAKEAAAAAEGSAEQTAEVAGK